MNAFEWDKANADGIFRVFEQFIEKIKRKVIIANDEEWKRWLLVDFPKEYFKCFPKMIYPRWYIASFCKGCTNTRNWVHYADGSKGICLIHKTHNGAFCKGLKIKICHEFSTYEGMRSQQVKAEKIKITTEIFYPQGGGAGNAKVESFSVSL